MLLFKDKINYKLPHANGFEPHLDAPAYDHISKVEHVTANIAIDPATASNGCLEVVPGSHKMQVELAHGGRISDKWVEENEWLTVPLDIGDILIFGSHLAHRSGPNKSDKPRAMLYATYHAKSDGDDLREKYYKHRRVAFPPDHGTFSYWSHLVSRMFAHHFWFREAGRCGLLARLEDLRICCSLLEARNHRVPISALGLIIWICARIA